MSAPWARSSLTISISPLAQAAVLGASLCYALAPIWGQLFSELPAITTAAGAMGCAGMLMLPAAAILERPWMLALPPAQAVAAVVALAVVCTALAFVVFFALIEEIGPVRATVITYVNPAVAAILGVAILGEHLTGGMAVGFVLILTGSVLAARRPREFRAAGAG